MSLLNNILLGFINFSINRNFRRKLIWSLLGKKIPKFLHIPKTGGTYICQYESDKIPVITPMVILGHSYVGSKKYKFVDGLIFSRIGKKEIENDFIFTNVRNPYDFLVSYFIHAGGMKSKYLNKDHYDYILAQKGFNKFLKQISKRKAKYWPSKHFLFFNLFDQKGNLIVDWINRKETLDEDLEKLAKYKGMKFVKKERQRVSGKNRDYKKFYDKKLINIVKNTWGRELKLFGYNFDGLNLKKAIIKNRITSYDKKRFKYFYSTDKFEIKGKAV